MEKKLFAAMVQSLKELKEIRAGRMKPSRVFIVEPLDVKDVRQRLKLSQRQFAALIGISIKTLQHWEQGRRKPVGPARALLRVAAANPRAVLAALHPKAAV